MKLGSIIRAVSILLLIGLGSSPGFSQTVNNLVTTGPGSNRVDMVFLGDGYTASEQNQFSADVQRAVDYYFNFEPYVDYKSYFNVKSIELISNQSGADHPERNEFKDTALDATYNCFNIQRLICVDSQKAFDITYSLLAVNEADIVVVLVNDSEYGGSGGALAVASTNQSSGDLVVHEVGHSFGLLADEYAGGGPSCDPTVEPAQLNVTRATNRNNIKWNAGGGPPNGWIEPSTAVPTNDTVQGQPGLYEGGKYCDTGLYRPTFSSAMRTLGAQFESVNEELLIRQIYSYVSPLESSLPVGADISLVQGAQQTFSVDTINNQSQAVVVTWYVDGFVQGSGNTHTIDTSVLTPGSYVVKAVVSDTNDRVRNDPFDLLIEERTWNVTVLADVLEKTTLISPIGDINTGTPVYSWTRVPGATAYRLAVREVTGLSILKVFTSADANCDATGALVCSVTEPTPVSGDVSWWVHTINSSGYGPVSDALQFRVAATVPDSTTLVAPVGSSSTGTPTYVWKKVAGATSYRLTVRDASGVAIQKLYTEAQAGCEAASAVDCSVVPVTSVSGSVNWWVHTRNNSGYGPVSNALQFVVSAKLGATTLVSPSGSSPTSTPTYVWNRVDGATSYRLTVRDSSGLAVQKIYTEAQAGCAVAQNSNCSVSPAMAVGGNVSWWVHTRNAQGYGPVSNSLKFVVSAKPAATTLVSPSGTASDNPVYTWNKVANATAYRLTVRDVDGVAISNNYSAAAAGCSSSESLICSVTGPTTVSGNVIWWVHTRNANGFGPASSAFRFSVTSKPAATTLIGPSGTASENPSYSWARVKGATSYRLTVRDPSGVVIQKLYTASQAGCVSKNSICSIAPATSVTGSVVWWVHSRNANGYGPVSNALKFVVQGASASL